jgi:hypothetical protein
MKLFQVNLAGRVRPRNLLIQAEHISDVPEAVRQIVKPYGAYEFRLIRYVGNRDDTYTAVHVDEHAPGEVRVGDLNPGDKFATLGGDEVFQVETHGSDTTVAHSLYGGDPFYLDRDMAVKVVL